MYKTLAAAGIAAALLFAVPQGASALPGQGTAVKASSDVVQAGYQHRYYNRERRNEVQAIPADRLEEEVAAVN